MNCKDCSDQLKYSIDEFRDYLDLKKPALIKEDINLGFSWDETPVLKSKIGNVLLYNVFFSLCAFNGVENKEEVCAGWNYMKLMNFWRPEIFERKSADEL